MSWRDVEKLEVLEMCVVTSGEIVTRLPDALVGAFRVFSVGYAGKAGVLVVRIPDEHWENAETPGLLLAAQVRPYE